MSATPPQLEAKVASRVALRVSFSRSPPSFPASCVSHCCTNRMQLLLGLFGGVRQSSIERLELEEEEIDVLQKWREGGGGGGGRPVDIVVGCRCGGVDGALVQRRESRQLLLEFGQQAIEARQLRLEPKGRGSLDIAHGR